MRVFLFKSFLRALRRQLYIKLTKFTRRSNGPVSFFRKFASGYGFLKDMAAYNLEVVHRCRQCVTKLSAGNVESAFVYGERDIVEVLQALSLEMRLRLGVLREDYEADKKFGWKAEPVKRGALSSEKIIVASLVNTEERISRLRALGVDSERIILLDT